jgi:hypothetical protein
MNSTFCQAGQSCCGGGRRCRHLSLRFRLDQRGLRCAAIIIGESRVPKDKRAPHSRLWRQQSKSAFQKPSFKNQKQALAGRPVQLPF